MFQNKLDVPRILKSDKILERGNDQPEMILTEEVLEQSPDVYVNAIHSSSKTGTTNCMNFELSNGYVTKQTYPWTTAHRHVIPGAVFTHTTQVLVHYYSDWIFGNILGFRFLDA